MTSSKKIKRPVDQNLISKEAVKYRCKLEQSNKKDIMFSFKYMTKREEFNLERFYQSTAPCAFGCNVLQ